MCLKVKKIKKVKVRMLLVIFQIIFQIIDRVGDRAGDRVGDRARNQENPLEVDILEILY
jgi:hypothetical protein